MDDRIERVLVGWDNIDEHRTGTPGDAQTARWLAAEIESLGAQAWMTGTGTEMFDGLGGDALRLNVSENGGISAVAEV